MQGRSQRRLNHKRLKKKKGETLMFLLVREEQIRGEEVKALLDTKQKASWPPILLRNI